MKTNTLGYPRVNGANDFEDSSHLAGILAITEHSVAVDLTQYVTKDKYIRCPDSKYDFSRDQFIVLAVGLIKQGRADLVSLDLVNGKDIMPPSVQGLVRIAKGKKPRFYQSLWLKAEIYWHSYIQPLEEPNQIIALCSAYGDEYLKLWTKHNQLYIWSVRRYWSELDGFWRDEADLAEHIINYISSKIAS